MAPYQRRGARTRGAGVRPPNHKRQVPRCSRFLKTQVGARFPYNDSPMMTEEPPVQPTSPSDASPAWDKASLRNPHAVADKRRRVQRMFAAIAPSYDLNNRLHTLWMDQAWRHRAVALSKLRPD